MGNFFKQTAEILRQGKPFALATIVEGKGSLPRAVGTQMAVRQDGSIVATIGGGRMEGEALLLAAEVLRTEKSQIMTFDMTHPDARGVGMICGGRGRVAICHVCPEALSVMEAAAAAEQLGTPSWLFILWNAAETRWEIVYRDMERVIAIGETTRGGANQGRKSEFEGLPTEPGLVELPDGRFAFGSRILSGGNLYLCGAGHVGAEIARIATYLDFSVTAMDDRAEFANEDRFPGCRCIVLEDMTAPPAMSLGEDDYVLIATRGHPFDLSSLRWAMQTGAGYIGMIGSRRKRDLIYKVLREEGITDQQLEQVHSPIGISIGAQTPEEIAISMAAQLIQVRSKYCG